MGKFSLFVNGDSGKEEIISICRDNLSHIIVWINDDMVKECLGSCWKREEGRAILVRNKNKEKMMGWQLAGIMDQFRLDQMEIRDPWTYKRYSLSGSCKVNHSLKEIQLDSSFFGDYDFDRRTGKIDFNPTDKRIKPYQGEVADDRSW